MLAKYGSSIANEYGIKIGGVNVLVPNLANKSKYVLHYRNLFDLTKLLMYEFHYGYVKRKYNNKLLFTYRDSLVYQIKTKEVMKIFMKIKVEIRFWRLSERFKVI